MQPTPILLIYNNFVRVHESKPYIMKYFIMLSILFLCFSCKKEVEPTPTNNTTNTSTTNIFEFDYDGSNYLVTDIISAGIISNNLTASGIKENGPDQYDNLNLTIKINNPQVGTYQLDSGGTALNYISITLPSSGSGISQETLFSQYSTSQGEVIIDEINHSTKRIKGTFYTNVSNGQGGQDFIISNGVFNIPFVE